MSGTAASDEGLGPAWRAAQLAAQQHALPGGSVAVSCSAPPGLGGLGRHSSEIALALERQERRPSLVAGAG
ncbi:MAG: hypothetical protein ACYDC2_05290, partial [Solirubrobacteraceae bacterium]